MVRPMLSRSASELNNLFIYSFRWTVCLAEIGQEPQEHINANHQDSKYRQIFRLRALHLIAIFIFVYVGVEVTIGGVSF